MISDQVTVSLIIPVYNESQFIQPLFDSIRRSSVQPTEILICDNNSTDDTCEQIKKYKGELPIKVLHEAKKGILPTVEKLWRSAKGELIFKIDADSELPRHWIEKGSGTKKPKTGCVHRADLSSTVNCL
jgi:glycosyltransferase involved in cell wall biosynthesis